MAKSTKRFVISNGSLNSQGFRMLTAGADLDSFKKNPLLLFNHQRPEGNMKNQILPLGHWEDIEVKGDDITGVPVFDDKDDFAMSIFNKVEAGHLRMCSAGAEPIATSKKKEVMLPGQKLETVIKWQLKEASICDIGANPDSLVVALYDKNDRKINLSETKIETIIPKITDTMSKQKTTAGAAFEAQKKAKEAKENAQKLVTLAAEKVELALADEDTSDDDKKQLSDDAEPDTDEDKDKKIAALAAKCKELQDQVEGLTAKLQEEDGKKEEMKATALADKALALRKITLTQKPMIVRMAKADYKAAEEYVNSLKASVSVQAQLAGSTTTSDKDGERIAKLSEKSYDELFKSGELAFLKNKAPETYKLKFKDKFGKEPKNA